MPEYFLPKINIFEGLDLRRSLVTHKSRVNTPIWFFLHEMSMLNFTSRYYHQISRFIKLVKLSRSQVWRSCEIFFLGVWQWPIYWRYPSQSLTFVQKNRKYIHIRDVKSERLIGGKKCKLIEKVEESTYILAKKQEHKVSYRCSLP